MEQSFEKPINPSPEDRDDEYEKYLEAEKWKHLSIEENRRRRAESEEKGDKRTEASSKKNGVFKKLFSVFVGRPPEEEKAKEALEKEQDRLRWEAIKARSEKARLETEETRRKFEEDKKYADFLKAQEESETRRRILREAEAKEWPAEFELAGGADEWEKIKAQKRLDQETADFLKQQDEAIQRSRIENTEDAEAKEEFKELGIEEHEAAKQRDREALRAAENKEWAVEFGMGGGTEAWQKIREDRRADKELADFLANEKLEREKQDAYLKSLESAELREKLKSARHEQRLKARQEIEPFVDKASEESLYQATENILEEEKEQDEIKAFLKEQEEREATEKLLSKMAEDEQADQEDKEAREEFKELGIEELQAAKDRETAEFLEDLEAREEHQEAGLEEHKSAKQRDREKLAELESREWPVEFGMGGGAQAAKELFDIRKGDLEAKEFLAGLEKEDEERKAEIRKDIEAKSQNDEAEMAELLGAQGTHEEKLPEFEIIEQYEVTPEQEELEKILEEASPEVEAEILSAMKEELMKENRIAGDPASITWEEVFAKIDGIAEKPVVEATATTLRTEAPAEEIDEYAIEAKIKTISEDLISSKDKETKLTTGKKIRDYYSALDKIEKEIKANIKKAKNQNERTKLKNALKNHQEGVKKLTKLLKQNGIEGVILEAAIKSR